MEVRELREGEEEAVVELLDAVFNKWPRYDLDGSAVDFWRWKYQNNPIPAKSLVIEHEGKLVSSYHSWRQRVWVEQKTWTFESGMDFTVHPEYRRRGLSTKIAQLARELAQEDGVPVSNTVTEQPIILHGHKKNKAVHPFPKNVVNLTRINNIGQQLEAMPVKNGWLIKLGYPILVFLSRIQNRFRSKSNTHNIHITQIASFSKSINSYWKQINESLDYSLEISDQYLNWRYCDPRIGGYQIHIAEEGNQPVGFVVTRINKKYPEYPIGYIVELSYLPNRPEIGYKLLEKALSYLSEVNVVNFLTIEGHPDIELLKRFGFLNSRISIHVYYENYIPPDPLETLKDSPPKKIHVSWGDFDILPVKMPKDKQST